ncbi:quinone oxidoreductase isoform X2 [Gadus macrocephalus]|uniref:quinone oxidoreductase isoform X2 n=1 Tax=Gadus macrocephalus TaxID=80720 RepID=UPI0028CB5721|nr:quinone oxidoreductase isoform X2 [Gadus macrocephalus]
MLNIFSINTMKSCRVMKAVCVSEFGGPEVLRLLSDVPVPTPGRRQVLIRVRACGVNPVETYIRAGTYARRPPLPYTPGSDVSGEVQEVGEEVTSFKAGERVFTTATLSGGYAELCVAEEASVFRLPAGLSPEQGAALGVPYCTAHRALVTRAHAKAGETVLIHGASGGVGVAAVQLGRALGLRVLGTAGTRGGLDLVLQQGAHQVFNHREEDYTHKILEATGGAGVDVVLEMLANLNLGADLQMLRQGGRVAVVGSRGSVEINPRDTMAKESSILGVALASATPEEREECMAALSTGMEEGWLRPSVGRCYPLKMAAQAHQDLMEGPGACGKTVLTM